PPALDSITPTPTTAQVNAEITLTVHMTVAVSTDTVINLSSAAGGSVPATVTVNSGSQTADFVFTAGGTAVNGVIVTAHYLTVDKTASVDITPLTVASVTPATASVM